MSVPPGCVTRSRWPLRLIAVVASLRLDDCRFQRSGCQWRVGGLLLSQSQDCARIHEGSALNVTDIPQLPGIRCGTANPRCHLVSPLIFRPRRTLVAAKMRNVANRKSARNIGNDTELQFTGRSRTLKGLPLADRRASDIPGASAVDGGHRVGAPAPAPKAIVARADKRQKDVQVRERDLDYIAGRNALQEFEGGFGSIQCVAPERHHQDGVEFQVPSPLLAPKKLRHRALAARQYLDRRSKVPVALATSTT